MKKVKLLGMAVVAMIGLVGMTGCGKKKVDLNQYVKLNVSGVDTMAVASVNFDYDEFEEDVTKLLKDGHKSKGGDEFEEALDLWDLSMEAEECFEFEVEPAEKISNGDTVVVKAKIDEEKADELKLKFKFKEIKQKVEGLEKARVIREKELFKDVIVEFTGSSPNADVQIRNTSKDEFISSIDFIADKTCDLRKGDTIVVTAQPSYADESVILETTTKKYKVDKVGEYISSVDQLSDEQMKKILNQASDMIEAELKAKNMGYTNVYEGSDLICHLSRVGAVENVKMETSYFCSLKEGLERGYGDSWNRLDITYSFDVKGLEGSEDTENAKGCYISIQCDDIIKDRDGELQFDLGDMDFTYKAYATKDSFYQNVIVPNKSNYNVGEVDLTKYEK